MIIEVKNGNGVDLFNQEIIQRNKPCFAMFHMDGCGHCEELRPKWERMKPKVHTNVILAEIDSNSTGEVGRLMRNDLNILGFPTLAVIKNRKKVKEYHGPREEHSILQFIRDNFSTKKKSRKKRRKFRRSTRKKHRKIRRLTRKKRRQKKRRFRKSTKKAKRKKNTLF